MCMSDAKQSAFAHELDQAPPSASTSSRMDAPLNPGPGSQSSNGPQLEVMQDDMKGSRATEAPGVSSFGTAEASTDNSTKVEAGNVAEVSPVPDFPNGGLRGTQTRTRPPLEQRIHIDPLPTSLLT